MEISVDKESVVYVEWLLRERKMSRSGGIIGTLLLFKDLQSIVLLLLSIQAIRSMNTT
jgi:hypothetical protein